MAHHISPYKADSIAPWAPPNDEVEAQDVGVVWDAVRMPRGQGLRALRILAQQCDTLGAVIDDGHVLYWLIRCGAADDWTIPGVRVLGGDAVVAVPPARRQTGPGVHWRVPLSADYLTDPDILHAAAAAAAGPDADR